MFNRRNLKTRQENGFECEYKLFNQPTNHLTHFNLKVDQIIFKRFLSFRYRRENSPQMDVGGFVRWLIECDDSYTQFIYVILVVGVLSPRSSIPYRFISFSFIWIKSFIISFNGSGISFIAIRISFFQTLFCNCIHFRET